MANRKYTLEELQTKKLIDDAVKKAIKEYDEQLQKTLVNLFIINLSKFETAYSIGRWVVAAVGLLLIGTAYQIFIALAKIGIGKG